MAGQGIRVVIATLIAGTALVGRYDPASAQAWLPERGTGSVSLSCVFFKGGDHVFSTDRIDGESTRGYVADGNHWFLGDAQALTAYTSFELGFSDRLAATANIAHVTAKYDGRSPDFNTDDGRYRGTFQDARVELRGQLWEGPVVVTPFAGVSFPVRDYETRGHSAPGGGVSSLQLGINVGRQLNPFLPAAYLHGRFSYGIAEQVSGYDLRRSNLDIEAGYIVLSRVAIRAFASRQETSGGLDWISDEEGGDGTHSAGLINLHNQITAEEFTRIGAGLTASISSSLDAYGAAITTVGGKNTDDATMVSVGTSWNFRAPWADEE